ncbi:MAG TPA: AMP-binding protein [Terriglobales bacterium]|nr:AMP-binding protein [Terriglobales bacterium]
MSFLDDIFRRLQTDAIVLHEKGTSGSSLGVPGRGLLQKVGQARAFLRRKGLKKGDRCALLAHNGIEWVAADLAIMAEGLIVVPLYARQAPVELVKMMKDCSPLLICCGDAGLRDAIAKEWPEAPPQILFEELFAARGESANEPPEVVDADPVAIIYTSGTSGEAKGVMLSAGNIGHMLGCTSGRLDLLMQGHTGQERVFHYLPLCFAGSWILLLTSLLRQSLITLNTDLTRLSNEMREAAPDYFLNVPQLLERMRKAVDEQLWKSGGFPLTVYSRAKGAWMKKQEGKETFSDSLWLGLARAAIFPTIRKKMIGANLKALICGSAPLNVETQLYFMMLGIPVLQGYGLTETTALCTLDDPRDVEPGRVGPAIAGVEMRLGEDGEILVRGPNIFSGYWSRPEETKNVMREGWFHTGDQGDVDGKGNWRIAGRIKNLIILGSGHNVAPEPIEEKILGHLPGALQVVLMGNGRGYLSALVTGAVTPEKVQAALDAVNADQPHYKQVRVFQICPEVFAIDNGLLTANGKLKRDLIAERYRSEIEEMYRVKQAV